MVTALFDTNILIDYLNGIEQARDEIARYETKTISIVSWMEVMVGAEPDIAAETRAFLEAFAIVALDSVVAERAVVLRRAHRIKLPDAIIWASAQKSAALLVTRNDKDFADDDPGVRMPYRLGASSSHSP